MKTRFGYGMGLAALLMAALSVAPSRAADTLIATATNILPVISITAVDREAAEIPPDSEQPSNPGIFRVSRAGPTHESLRVRYALSGSASNGADYSLLPGIVELPAGAREVDIVIEVIDDDAPEGTEAVVLTLVRPTCADFSPAPPGCYRIGPTNQATILIADTPLPTNRPPTVQLTYPTEDAVFSAPDPIRLFAHAEDPDGFFTIRFVEFFAGTNSLGVVTNSPLLSPDAPFLRWTHLPVGEYALTAKVTDTGGLMATSAPVHITVRSEPVDERELHVVGIYSGTGTGGNHERGDATVFVNRPGKRVTLYLSAYEPVLWEITAINGTTIEKIVLSGYYEQTVSGPEAQVVRTNLFIGDSLDSGRFFQHLPMICALTGLDVSSFHGRAEAPGPFVIAGVQSDERLRCDYPQPTPLSQLPQLTFRLAFYSGAAPGQGNVFFRDYTLGGPQTGTTLLPAMRVVADGGQRYYYGSDGPGVRQATRVDSWNGTAEPIVFTPIAEDLGWEMGTAFDSMRRQILLVTLGGEGFLYGLGPDQSKWTRLASMNNLDVDCLEYHAPGDALYAVKINHAEEGKPLLYEFSPTGALRRQLSLPVLPFDIAPAQYRTELVSVGEYLVLLLEPEYAFSANIPPQESRIYLIDPRTEQVWLTYRQPVPPPNQPPIIRFLNPQDGAVFPAPANLSLLARVEDPDGPARGVRVEFFAGTQSLGFGQFVDPGPPNEIPFRLTWPHVPAGEYSLTARATDDHGAVSLSPPVRITVVDTNRAACRPRIEWQASYGGSSAEFLREVRSLADGGYILAGSTLSGADGNKTTPPLGEFDGWVVRIDATGAVVWQKSLGGVGADWLLTLEPTADGSFVVGGNRDYRFSATKLDARGEIVWDREYADGTVSSIQTLPEGGYVLAGSTFFGGNRILHVDEEGEVIWDRSFGMRALYRAQVVRRTPDSGFFLGATAVTSEGTNFWVIRLDAQGNRLWERLYAKAGHADFRAMEMTADGGAVLGGIDTGAWLLIRIAADGSELWRRSYDGDWQEFAAFRLLPDGGFLLSGNATSFCCLGRDYWLLRLDADGNKLWDQSFGGTSDDSLSAIDLTADGGVILGGSSSSFVSGNPFSLDFDYWVVKLSPLQHCDSDGDGIPNERDQCPDTPPGDTVNADGCSVAQLCPCHGRWHDHGEYVNCVINRAWQFYRDGLITETERSAIIAEAARSDCGGHNGVRLHLQPQSPEELDREGRALILSGDMTGTCILECSTDLKQWTAIQTIPMPNAAMTIMDPRAGEAALRFYRVRLSP